MTPAASLPAIATMTFAIVAGYAALASHVAHANSDPFGGRLTGVHASPLYREPAGHRTTQLRPVRCLDHAQGVRCFAATR